MKQPQLFIELSKNRYMPVDSPRQGLPMFVWDEEQHRIVPCPPEKSKEKSPDE